MSSLFVGRKKVIIGGIGLAAFVVFMVALFNKQPILTALRPGDSIKAEFARDYKLEPDSSEVKIAGTPVGVVSGIEQVGVGRVEVSMKLDDGVIDKLGSAPSAEIRPTTVLGGKYYVSLRSGGTDSPFMTGVIPRDRTQTPVELDQVLRAIPPNTQQSAQRTTAQLDDMLRRGAGSELRKLLADAPGTLRPASTVIDAFRGTRPGTDLVVLVGDLESAAVAMTKQDGQLGSIVDRLASTTRALAQQSEPLADTIDSLPATLRSTRWGVRDLQGTLERLRVTAGDVRPAVRQLEPLLRKLDPVLQRAQPLVRDLKPLLAQTRPLVEELVPASQAGTSVLRDVRGPVLKRLNGPIVDTILSEWHGKEPKYPNGGGTGHKFYEELGYMFANAGNSVKAATPNGHLVNFQVGVGTESVMGDPIGLDKLLERLATMMGPPHRPGSPPLDLNPIVDTLRLLAPQQLGAPTTAPDGEGGQRKASPR